VEPGQIENPLAGKWETKTEGLLWRPFKLYWKKLLSVSLMLLLPGGLWILGLFLIASALNWGAGMQPVQEKQFEKWKEESDS
jgi:hypothetical protein